MPALDPTGPGTSPAADLLARMRAGDRHAAAEFIRVYGSRIQRRVRPKLGVSVRRLFDSQDIVSTVARRLDAYVAGGKLRAENESQLWAFVFRLTSRAVMDKVWLTERLRRAESEDGPLATGWLRRIERISDDAHIDFDMEDAFAALPDEIDRQILALWLHDTPSADMAAALGMPAGTVRWRWSRIRETLRAALSNGEDTP